MKLHPAVIVAAVVALLATAAVTAYCLITLLQGIAVLLEIIAIALETSL